MIYTLTFANSGREDRFLTDDYHQLDGYHSQCLVFGSLPLMCPRMVDAECTLGTMKTLAFAAIEVRAQEEDARFWIQPNRQMLRTSYTVELCFNRNFVGAAESA